MNAPPSGKRWHTREDSGIRLDRDGRWWHDDELVEHPKIIEAFNTGLIPTDDRRFKLQFGSDWCFVEVEDAAYRVVAVDARPDGIGLRLSDRTAELLEPATLSLDAEGVLSCRVKQGRAKARFTRDAQFAVGEFLDEEGGQLVVRAGGRSWPVSQR
ncbi:MAG: DUF1285 domain-containing protein [Myxococcaceae bacterium]